MYYYYLQTLRDRFYDAQKCNFSIAQTVVIMDVPPEITINPPSPDEPNGITLAFKDEAKAIAWEQAMILWKIDSRKSDVTVKRQLKLVAVWEVDVFLSKLVLSKDDSDEEKELRLLLMYRGYSKPDYSPKPVDHLVTLYRSSKAALRPRLGRAKDS